MGEPYQYPTKPADASFWGTQNNCVVTVTNPADKQEVIALDGEAYNYLDNIYNSGGVNCESKTAGVEVVRGDNEETTS